MLRGRQIVKTGWAILAAASLLLALGCGPDEEAVAAAARDEEWSALQEMKQELQEKRAELTDLRERMEDSAAEAGEDAEEMTEEAKAELEKEYNNLDFEVQNLTADFGERLVNFINDDPMEAGAEPTESQLAALRLKASEDLIIADEYGERGGDWARAITIAEEAERVDPANPEVQQRLEHYRAMRYMTEERLSQAEVGMTLEEVKDVLGVPSRGNDREFSETRRAFYYLKGPDRSAAAVFFEKKGDDWITYKVDFDALAGSEE